jgi:hypothetical protein
MPVENSTKKDVLPEKKSEGKSWIVFLSLGIFGILGGAAGTAFSFLTPKEELPDLAFPQIPSAKAADTNIYSNLK